MSVVSAHDVIVIGAGPAGEVCAGGLAGEGLDVALVERELVGGECSFWACMPSKALLRPRAPGRGTARPGRGRGAGPSSMSRRCWRVATRSSTTSTTPPSCPWIEDRDITLIRGQARLDGERRVRVGDALLTARRAVVIAVGSGAAYPAGARPSEISPWTNRAGTTAKAVPARLTVLGGGVVGCELAQAWARSAPA